MPAPFYARRSHAFPSEGKVSPKVTDEVSKTLKNAEKEGLSTPSCGARKTQWALRAVPCVFRPLRQPLLAVSAPGGARRRCPRRCPALGLESTLHSQNKRHDPVGHASCFGGEGGTRTLAPVTRPTPLAGAPRHQLEYFSMMDGSGAHGGRAEPCSDSRKCGGEEGIRTLGSFESPVFKTGSLNRSDTSPCVLWLFYHFYPSMSTLWGDFFTAACTERKNRQPRFIGAAECHRGFYPDRASAIPAKQRAKKLPKRIAIKTKTHNNLPPLTDNRLARTSIL